MSYLGHALVENNNELIASAMVTPHAYNYAGRDAALLIIAEKQQDHTHCITIGADKAYDTTGFVRTVRDLHASMDDKRRSNNLDRRTIRQPGYAASLGRRWLVEKGLGWLNQIGPLPQVKLRGLENLDWLFVFSCVAHNLIRRPELSAPPSGRGHGAVRLNHNCGHRKHTG